VVLGVSPRGGVALQRASQALALLRGRDFVTPDDVKTVAPPVMAHRLLSRKRGLENGRKAVRAVLEQVDVPV
jgi:MoxR-like ATPase